MASLKTKFTVGLFVLIGFSIVTVAIVWLGMSDYFEKGTHYTAFFDESVQGLEKDSSVKYRGVAIGRVESIGVAPDAKLIQVVLKIEKGLKLDNQLKNIVAQLKSVGITGIMFIELDQKKAYDPDLSPKLSFEPRFPAIATKPSDITKLLKGVQDVVAQFNSLDIESISKRLKMLLDDLDESVQDINFKQISAKMISSLEKIESLLDSTSWDSLMQSIDSTGRSIDSFAKNADKTVSGVNRAVSRIDRLVAGNEADLTKSISNFKHLVGRADNFFSQGTDFIKKGDGELTSLNHQLTTVLQHLETAIDNLNRLIEIIAAHPSQLLFGKPPPSRKVEPE